MTTNDQTIEAQTQAKGKPINPRRPDGGNQL